MEPSPRSSQNYERLPERLQRSEPGFVNPAPFAFVHGDGMEREGAKKIGGLRRKGGNANPIDALEESLAARSAFLGDAFNSHPMEASEVFARSVEWELTIRLKLGQSVRLESTRSMEPRRHSEKEKAAMLRH